MYFLIERQRRLSEVQQNDSVPLVSDFLFEKDKIFAYINLDNEELKLYERYYEMFAAALKPPDLVIYLQANPEVLRERIAKKEIACRRNRSRALPRGSRPRLRTFLLPLLLVGPARHQHIGNRFRRAQRRPTATPAPLAGAGEGHAIFPAPGRKRVDRLLAKHVEIAMWFLGARIPSRICVFGRVVPFSLKIMSQVYPAVKDAPGYLKSLRYTTPPFITNFTRSISVMSLSGLPERLRCQHIFLFRRNRSACPDRN